MTLKKRLVRNFKEKIIRSVRIRKKKVSNIYFFEILRVLKLHVFFNVKIFKT